MKKVSDPIDVHAGSRVRMRRNMMNMSQEKLGDLLGLTFQQVQKYEKGTNRMGSSRLAQIAAHLQVPVAFFFDGAPLPEGIKANGHVPDPSFITKELAKPDGLALITAFSKIKSIKKRRSIINMVEQMEDGE